MNFLRRHPVDFALGLGDVLKHGDRFFLHLRRQFAAADEFFDFLKRPVPVVMMMGVLVWSSAFRRSVPSRERRDGTPNALEIMLLPMMVIAGAGQMDIKLHAGDAGFLFARDVKMIAAEFQLLQLALQLARIRTEVNQRADEHVAADAAENIEVKRFHFL